MTAAARKTTTKKAASAPDAAAIPSKAIVPTNAELVTVENLTPAQIFTTAKVNELLNKVKEAKDAFRGDASTQKGQNEIKSFAYRFTKTKTLLDDMGKDYVAVLKDEPKRIDGLRKSIRDQLDAWAEEVRAPVTEIERKDAVRKAAHDKVIADIGATITFPPGQPSSAEVQRRIDFVAAQQSREWEEYAGLAETTVKGVSEVLANTLVTAKKAEEDAAELARMKKEAAEKAQAERIEKARLEGIAEGERRAEAAASVAPTKQDQAPPNSEYMKSTQNMGATTTVSKPPVRSADVEHKARVHREILASLLAYGCTEIGAKALITAIAKGTIANVYIEYGE